MKFASLLLGLAAMAALAGTARADDYRYGNPYQYYRAPGAYDPYRFDLRGQSAYQHRDVYRYPTHSHRDYGHYDHGHYSHGHHDGYHHDRRYNRQYSSPYYYYRSPSYYGGYSSWGYPYSSYSSPFRGYSQYFAR